MSISSYTQFQQKKEKKTGKIKFLFLPTRKLNRIAISNDRFFGYFSKFCNEYAWSAIFLRQPDGTRYKGQRSFCRRGWGMFHIHGTFWCEAFWLWYCVFFFHFTHIIIFWMCFIFFMIFTILTVAVSTAHDFYLFITTDRSHRYWWW